MSAKKATFLFLGAILLGFLMIQPFNYICRLTDKCFPINLSYYLPKSTGKERYEIFFMTKDYIKSLQFTPAERSKIVYSGSDVSIVYRATNNSNHKMKIRPMPYFEPEEMEKYIHFYECLCFKEHTIDAGETVELMVRFRLDPKIEKDDNLKDRRQIVVGYELQD